MRKEFFGYPSWGVKNEIINRRSVLFTASDGADVKYLGRDLSFKLTYRGGRAGLNSIFQQNEHLSSSVSGDQPISNLVAVDDKNGLLRKVSDCGCYRCTGLSSAYLPAVSALDGYAFQKCSGLLSVYAPKVVTLGDSAFHECTKIEYLDFPAAAAVGNTTFHSCRNLRKINLPGVSSFGANSLQQSNSDISIYINQQDTPPEIAVELTNFSVPSKSVFQVKNETYKKYLADEKWLQLSSHLQTVTRPVVTFICVDTVAKAETLNWGMSAVAPTVTREGYIFDGWDGDYNTVTCDTSCYAKWKEDIDKDILFYASDGTTVKYAICELSSETVSPNKLQFRMAGEGDELPVIPPYSLNEHLSSGASLKTDSVSSLVAAVDYNGHILSVGAKSCMACDRLSSADLPAAAIIGDDAFNGCILMTCANVSSAARIGNSAFAHTRLSAAYLPSVTWIGGMAFGYPSVANSLKRVDLPAQDRPPTLLTNGVFASNDGDLTVWVKDQTYKSYISATYWRDISAKISSYTQPKVSFFSDSQLYSLQVLNYGMSAVAPVISRPYYDFKGWDNSYVDVTADVSCNAIFSKRYINPTTTTLDMSSHIVTGTSADYEHECNEINPGVSCMVDGVLTLLSNSVDYTLSYENNKVEWYGVNIGETKTQTAQVKITGINYYSGTVSTDFTVGYTRNGSGKFTVTFDPCGGDVPGEPQSIEYSQGDTYGLCSQFNVLDTTASRAGHSFLGWFEEGKDTRVLSTDTIEKTEPYTLSAHWETNRFGLSAFTNPGDHGTINGIPSVFISTDIPWNSTITLSAEPDIGFEFEKWSDETQSGVKDVLITQDTTLTAKFRYIIYTLTTEIVPQNAGTTSNPTGVRYNDGVWLSAKPNEGYEFNRWNTDDSIFQIDQKTQISTLGSLKQTTNASISAVFTPVTYTITYELDGGTNNPNNPTSYTIESETIPLCAATKYQHAFQKWTEDGNEIIEISSGSMGDKTLSANFVRSLVTARYHANLPLEDKLYFQSQEENSTIKLQNVAGTYKTSTDGKTWSDYTLGTLCTLTNIGDKIYFSAISSNDTCWNNNNNGKFFMTGKIAAYGNMQYLIDSTGKNLSVADSCYRMMFCDCSSLTQAPELPATTLGNNCYRSTFYNCTSLTQSPELPSKKLANDCYFSLFNLCSALTSAPELPAETLATECYRYMFYGCSSLTRAPVLSATTLAGSCYFRMFYNCKHLSVTTDSTKPGAYQILSVDSTTASNWGTEMFVATGAEFHGTPETGIPYYCWGN